MKKTLIIFILILFSSIKAQTFDNNLPDAIINKGINQIYNLKFDAAKKTFEKIKTKNLPAFYFFKSMLLWWEILLDLNNESKDDLFIETIDTTIDFCDSQLDKDENNSLALFFKGGALGFKGLLQSIRMDWFSAVANGADALELVYTAYNLDSSNVDLKLGFGIYNYFAEALPEKYPAAKPLMIFLPSGNKTLGLQQLHQVAEDGRFAKIEAKYTLVKIYHLFEKKYFNAIPLEEELIAQFPDNPIFLRYYGKSLIAQYGYKNAYPIFEKIYLRCTKGDFGFNENFRREAAYYLGMKQMSLGENNSALKYFAECETLCRKIDKKDNGFLTNSILYQGMLFDLLNRRPEAIEKYKQVLDVKNYKQAHEKAEKYLEKQYQK